MIDELNKVFRVQVHTTHISIILHVVRRSRSVGLPAHLERDHCLIMIDATEFTNGYGAVRHIPLRVVVCSHLVCMRSRSSPETCV